MNELIIPDRMLTTSERTLVAQHSINTLLETMSAVEGYVILAQMEKIVEETKEMLKEKAITGIQGKEMMVFGAKVTTRRKTEYEYEAPTLERLKAQKTAIADQEKAVKKMLEAKGTYIDDETGEVNTANKISDGLQIAVSLPKD